MTFEPTTILLISFVLFSAGAIQGLTGFGYGLIVVPTMLIILPPKLVVPIVVMHGLVLNTIVFVNTRKSLSIKRVLPLTIAGLCGLPIGVLILKHIDVDLLKVFIGVVVVIFSTILLTGKRFHVKNERLALIPVGLTSGILSGSSSMGGPPVILFQSNQQVNKDQFRANIIAYFLMMNIVSIPTFAMNGLVSAETVKYALMSLPTMIIGTVIGIKFAKKVDEELFRRIALIIVLLAGLFLTWSGSKQLIN